MSVLNAVLSAPEKQTFGEILEEMWKAIVRDWFTMDYMEYDNLGYDMTATGGVRPETVIVFGILGMMLACFFASYNKGTLGAFVRALLSAGASSPDTAKTLGELGFLKNHSVRASLKSGYTLRKVVRCVEEDEGTLICNENKEGSVPFNEAHFYIPEDKQFAAESRFKGKKLPWYSYLLIFVGGVILMIVLIAVLPHILSLIDDFIGGIKPESNILT